MMLRGPGAGLEGMWPYPPGEPQKRVGMARHWGQSFRDLTMTPVTTRVGKRVDGRETFQNALLHPTCQSFP